jgi:hypothetical protein
LALAGFLLPSEGVLAAAGQFYAADRRLVRYSKLLLVLGVVLDLIWFFLSVSFYQVRAVGLGDKDATRWRISKVGSERTKSWWRPYRSTDHGGSQIGNMG